jgi:hypothetical protein
VQRDGRKTKKNTKPRVGLSFCHNCLSEQLKGIYGFDSHEVNPLILKHSLDFSFIFSGRLHAPRKWDLPQWKVPARVDWDLLTSGRYKPACHYFKKVKKSQHPALLYLGEGPVLHHF